MTAMLMAAAAGLAMPFENLKDVGTGNGKKWKDHPAFDQVDQQTYKATLSRCDSFFRQSIKACASLQDAVLTQCQELRGIRDAAKSGKGDVSLDIARHDVRFALKILRNALAHNNVLAIPNENEQIERLAFFSKNNWCSSCGRMDGWNLLVVPVNSFDEFLTAWFGLLKEPGAYSAVATMVADDGSGSES